MALAVMLLTAVPAGATQDDQDQLPVTDPFSCLICHDELNSPAFEYDAYWQKIEHSLGID